MEVSEFKYIILDYIRKISENGNCIFSPVCEEHGLTMMQVRVLTELYQSGSHTIGSLASDTCAAGANISAMCKKLEKMEFLKRLRDQEDERVVKVALTDKGYGIVTEIDRTLNNKFSEQIKDMDEETLNDIITGLEKLNILIQKLH